MIPFILLYEFSWLSKLNKTILFDSATDVQGKRNASNKILYGATVCSCPPVMFHIKSCIEREVLLCTVYSLLSHRDSSDFFLNLV